MSLTRFLRLSEDVAFASPLTPDACRERLRETTNSVLNLSSRYPVDAMFFYDQVSLKHRIWWRNSFQTVMACRIYPSFAGSIVRAELRMSISSMFFIVVWTVLLGAFQALLLSANGVSGLTILLPLAMIVAMITVVWIGRWLARDEKVTLMTFLTATLDARPLEGDLR